MVGTLDAPEIVPLHLRLHLKKTMNPSSKKNLQALGVQIYKQAKGKGERAIP